MPLFLPFCFVYSFIGYFGCYPPPSLEREGSGYLPFIEWGLERRNIWDKRNKLPLEYSNPTLVTFNKTGHAELRHFFLRRSLIEKPLFAMAWSPSSKRSIRPFSWVTCRSLVLLDHNLYIKEKAPEGIIPTSNLTVLWCL